MSALTSMKVRVSKTVFDDVILSEANINEITRARLQKIFYPGDYLAVKDGVLWVAEDEDCRHGTPSTNYLRPATELESAAWRVLTDISAGIY